MNVPILTHKRNIQRVLACIVGVTAIVAAAIGSAAQAQKTPQNWTFHTGNVIDWYPIRGGNFGPLSFDGFNLYVSNVDGYTYAVDSETGREKWQFRTDEYTIYGKGTDNDSLVYITDFDGRVYAVDRQTGQERWRFITPGLIKADTEPVVIDDIVYFGSRNGVLYALDKQTGEKKWDFKTKGIDQRIRTISMDNTALIHFGTFVVDEKRIYVNSASDDAIYALNRETGEELWRFDQYQYVHEKPMLGNTTITFRSDDDYFITLDKESGQVKWKWVAESGEAQRVFVTGDDLYYVDKNEYLYKYSSKGQQKEAIWWYRSNEVFPDLREWVAMSDRKLFMSTMAQSGTGWLRAIDNESGKEVWRFKTGFTQAVPQVDGESIYITSEGNVYALEKISGRQRWRFDGNGKVHSLRVTNEGIYLITIDEEEHISIYNIDKETGTEKWRMRTADLDSQSLVFQSGRLYYLSKDQRSVYSIGDDNRKREIGPGDFRRVLSSDLKRKEDKFGLLNRVGNELLRQIAARINLAEIEKGWDIRVTQNENEIDTFGIVELTINHDDSLYDNVWEDVVITASFTDEGGNAYVVKGFYYDKNTWKIRFSPNEIGTWKWRLTLKANPFVRESKSGSFVVKNSDEPGFLKIDPKYPQKLVFENEELFTPLGLQDCFIDLNHTGAVTNQVSIGTARDPEESPDSIRLSDLDTYLKTYGPQQAGFNLFRVNIDNCSPKLWREIDRAGNNYSINAGIWGDTVVEKLKEHGYRIWMSLFSFDLPLQGSIQEKAYREVLKGYLDYVVARYAAYVDIWELANEIHLDDEWLVFAGEYLKSIDPYKHPITVNWERPDLPQIDISSVHWYNSSDPLEASRLMISEVDKAKKWDKPVVFSEAGNTDANWDQQSALRMRVKLWTGFFKEAAFIFWNTSGHLFRSAGESANLYIGPTERQYTKSFREYVKDLNADLVEESVQVENNGIRGYGLSSDKHLLVYLYNGSSHTQTTQTILDVDVSRNGRLVWINPSTGQVLESAEAKAGEQRIRTPRFTIDLAMKISFYDE